MYCLGRLAEKTMIGLLMRHCQPT